VVGSSSHGNAYILETGDGSLLLECGVPFKMIKQALGYDLSRVCGCLLSHEHKDHSKAAQDIMLAGIEVYASWGTFNASMLGGRRTNVIQPLKQFAVSSFTILPFQVEHDAADPMGFIIQHPNEGKLVFLTDSYYSKFRFKDPNYIMVECNYILDILKANVEAGIVDEARKNRLLQSHFSLDHVKDFLAANITTETRKVVLIHLSDDNSDAARMQREVQESTGIETVVADAGMEIDLDLYPY